MSAWVRHALQSPPIRSTPWLTRVYAAGLGIRRPWTSTSSRSSSWTTNSQSGSGFCRARRAGAFSMAPGGHAKWCFTSASLGSSNAGESQVGSVSPRSSSPQVPLCEREAGWTSTRAAVRGFYDEARYDIREDIQDRLNADGGPNRSDLELELEYLMEDAVVGWREWRDTQIESVDCHSNPSVPPKGSNNSRSCALRLGLEDLRALWKLRVDERLPLQYLTHSAFWRDMVLSVGPGVLIPRPETELMVDFVIEAVEKTPALGHGVWADLGTGSGALAVGVARALPDVPYVYAADISPTPLAYASFNARRQGVGHRVRPIESNWFEGLRRAGLSSGSGPRLVGIVSNPPYIPSLTCTKLQAEVKDHEPVLALDGGGDLAVECLVPICEGAAEMLVKGGFLALETNGGEQALWTVSLLERLGFREVAIRRDLGGVDRFVTAIR